VHGGSEVAVAGVPPLAVVVVDTHMPQYTVEQVDPVACVTVLVSTCSPLAHTVADECANE